MVIIVMVAVAVIGIAVGLGSRPQPRPARSVANPHGVPLTVAGGGAEVLAAEPVSGPRPVVALPAVEAEQPRPELSQARTDVKPKPRASTSVAPQPDRHEMLAQRCADLDEARHAWCMRPALLQADRHLRAAYDQAIDAGVERATLVDYRRRWSRLRPRSRDDPFHVAAAYERMARELREATVARRGARG